MSGFCLALCSTLGVIYITTTDYHLQINGQVEHFKSTLISPLRRYVSEYQTDWDTYLMPPTYVDKEQLQRSIKLSPFSVELTQNLRTGHRRTKEDQSSERPRHGINFAR